MPFQPGQSGNPGGRPKGDAEAAAELRAACRAHSLEMIEILLKWARGKDARASVTATTALLDRGYGKPAQAITGADGDNEIRVVVRQLFAPADPAAGDT